MADHPPAPMLDLSAFTQAGFLAGLLLSGATGWAASSEVGRS
jgi:hypothetical protein